VEAVELEVLADALVVVVHTHSTQQFLSQLEHIQFGQVQVVAVHKMDVL
jgi:hypothetical protein